MSVRSIVVKIGGELVKEPLIRLLAAEITALCKRGDRVLVVHGGGPQATALQHALGQKPQVVGGRRITDAATLDVMKMTVGGAVNIDLCAALLAAGARPIGLSGASSLVVEARKRPPRVVAGGGPEPIDFGWVGDVIGCNRDLLELLQKNGYVPVLACLGATTDGVMLNINADTVANQVARAVRAEHLVLVTSTRGVLRDIADPGSRIPCLTIAEARAAIADGTVHGGMIPKLEESLQLCESGVGSVHIVGELAPGELARAIDQPGSVGTALLQ